MHRTGACSKNTLLLHLQVQSICDRVQIPAEMGLQRVTVGNGTQEQVHSPWTSSAELAWPERSCSLWGLRGLLETESGVDILQQGIAQTIVWCQLATHRQSCCCVILCQHITRKVLHVVSSKHDVSGPPDDVHR